MINRSQALEEAQQREFDLVVIGGGVAGAGVAQDAASRGLSVLIIEKDDFGSGSSSRTTKLIDGGLRYLEQMQFGLTRELCQERGLLEQLAPHMVRDFSFVLPVVKDKKFFGLKAQLGLTIYDLLSINARGVRSHERLGKKAALQAAPSLSEEMISGALRFHDCITDDARLVLEIIKSATTRGAAAINYLEAKGFEQIDGQVRKVLVRDRLGGRELSFDCRSCVNATGVWSDILLEQIEPGWQSALRQLKALILCCHCRHLRPTMPYFCRHLMVAMYLSCPGKKH
jgi:glycerol-3-phosphate dehydrogenase